jgi:hypothetical protein
MNVYEARLAVSPPGAAYVERTIGFATAGEPG